jgi:hypothetical protein
VAAAIAAREKTLRPVYTQIATAYCDLHDRSGRMLAVGVIRQELEWKTAREFLHWRIRRLLMEEQVVRKLTSESLTVQAAQDFLKANLTKAFQKDDDRTVAEFLETRGEEVEQWVQARRHQAAVDKVYELMLTLPAAQRSEVVRDLSGFCRVNSTSSLPGLPSLSGWTSP